MDIIDDTDGDRVSAIFAQLDAQRKESRAMAEAWTPAPLRGENSAAYIVRLWNAMPCLARKMPLAPREWNAVTIDEISGPWSTGERWAVAFVLSVWSPSKWTGFHLTDAASSLGHAERTVIAKWLMSPHWP